MEDPIDALEQLVGEIHRGRWEVGLHRRTGGLIVRPLDGSRRIFGVPIEFEHVVLRAAVERSGVRA